MNRARLAWALGVAVLMVLSLATVPATAHDAEPAGSVGSGAAASTTALARKDLTLALRDLSLKTNGLSFARPTGGRSGLGVKYRSTSRSSCGKYVCVHWVSKGADRPSKADKNKNKIPDWVETTRRTADQVIKNYVKSGYRKPRSDKTSKNHGPNGKLDIYLADLGKYGYYGYCDTDDPARKKKRAVSAYCVIDNNFSRKEFRGNPLNSLRVTLAHELFHAVQFGYDYREDRWLMEGTATWMEEQLYDSINDNRQFLRARSPLSDPAASMDRFDPTSSPAQYGVWSFFEYLSTKYPARRGKLPAIVRDIWKYADNSTSKRPRQWSAKAVNTVLNQRGTTLAAAFAEFSQVNLVPASFYPEGAAWPAAPAQGACALEIEGVLHSCSFGNFPIRHLASVSLKFDAPTTAPTVRFTANIKNVPYGAAKLTLVRKDGRVERHDFAPNGQITPAAFASQAYSHAFVTVSNGSIRFTCNKRTAFSCGGTPLDDGAFASVEAVPVV